MGDREIPRARASCNSSFTDRGVANFLEKEGWKTPDTYGGNFQEPAAESAVYIFVRTDLGDRSNDAVIYVGMSKNLAKRWVNHEVLRAASKGGAYIRRFFKPVQEKELRDTERLYIEKFDPPWNLACRVRGASL